MNLTHKVTISFGHTAKGEQLHEILINEIERQVIYTLSDLYGGATLTRGKGGYILEDGKLVLEDSTTVVALVGEGSRVRPEVLFDLAGEVAYTLSQESVLLAIEEYGNNGLPGSASVQYVTPDDYWSDKRYQELEQASNYQAEVLGLER